jgi:predicted O-linked N-acetylglucosamine transferase (SPINDLY family)
VTPVVQTLADGWKTVGLLCMQRGYYQQAGYALHKAVKIDPTDFRSFHDLGASLIRLGRLNEALVCIEACLALEPGFPPAIGQMASIASHAGCLRESVRGMHHVLAREPERLGFWHDLATNHRELHEFDQAYEAHERAVALKPSQADLLSAMIYTIDVDPRASTNERNALRIRWHRNHRMRDVPPLQHEWNERPRIGFVSADFRMHSVSNAYANLYFGLDRKKWAVFAYNCSPNEDEITARVKAQASVWVEATNMSDEALLEKIRNDKIDILVDLSGYTYGHRMRVFTGRAAPIQVHAAGYLMGTGLPEMDYILLDKVTNIPGELAEQVIEMPCALAYRPPEWAPSLKPLPALGNDCITFGYLGRWSKVDDGTAALWGRILAAVPTARLILKDKCFGNETNREEAAKRIGVSSDRIEFMTLTVGLYHLESHNYVDIGLDPLQQNGGVSTMEACWMGCPVVCMVGERVNSRVTASIMTAIGLPNFVTATPDEYFARAVQLAGDVPNLAHIRETMRDRMHETVANATLYAAAADRAFDWMIARAKGE